MLSEFEAKAGQGEPAAWPRAFGQRTRRDLQSSAASGESAALQLRAPLCGQVGKGTKRGDSAASGPITTAQSSGRHGH